jgi:Ca-activated chloride channel family protein
MHVIGFDVTEEEKAQLECMAKAGGGKYFTAKTAGQFKTAAKEVVEETQNFGTLKVAAIKNNKPFEAKVFYYHGGETNSFFNESTHQQSGVASRKLSPGIYDIKVVDIHTAGNPALTIEGIEIVFGKTVEKTVNFSNGILKVTSYMNGGPIGCPVDIYAPDGKRLMNMWTQQGSRDIELLQGTYDIKVTKVDIPGGNPVVWFRGVEIQPEQTVEKKADFQIGFLKVTATLDGKPFNTPVKLYKAGSTSNIGHWTSDNGSRTFPLVPGVYDVNVVSIKDNKQFQETKGISIEAGKTKSIDVAFPVDPGKQSKNRYRTGPR